MKRRKFIGAGSLAALPLITGFTSQARGRMPKASEDYGINLVLDGYFLEPKQYIQKLGEIEAESGITGDFYSTGGVISQLEAEFCEVTGKESAIYMPSGTMANELALRVLCSEKTKAIVHGDSHIYRDEGDSAQAIHNKRLVPINPGKHFFTAEELESTIGALQKGEAFYDGVGALSIENPVRRHHGKIVDLQEIKKVTQYAKTNGIRTHLDGARIHLASAYSGVPVRDYCALFDTVYISLYKYLGAAGGAILAGDQETIGQMAHMMKILGGTVFRSWTHAAVARHYLHGLDERLAEMVERSNALISQLKELDEFKIQTVPDGTNVVFLSSDKINMETFAAAINDTHGIWMNYPDKNEIQIHFNETILLRSNEQLIEAFKGAAQSAR